jgi:diacylglycerol kinase
MQNNLRGSNRQPFLKAFLNALNGTIYFFKTERNGKIQAVVAIAVSLAGFFLHLSSIEWIIVLLCISSVLILEMMNSALEHLCNLVHNEYHPLIKHIKDVSAGAVLIASLISAIIGLIIFIPKILSLL